jgi:hypothetical protein
MTRFKIRTATTALAAIGRSHAALGPFAPAVTAVPVFAAADGSRRTPQLGVQRGWIAQARLVRVWRRRADTA